MGRLDMGRSIRGPWLALFLMIAQFVGVWVAIHIYSRLLFFCSRRVDRKFKDVEAVTAPSRTLDATLCKKILWKVRSSLSSHRTE
jgi:hypothetical protein